MLIFILFIFFFFDFFFSGICFFKQFTGYGISAWRESRLAAGEGRPAPRVVALPGLFDLDDLGTHVAQHHRAERPGEDAREVQDAHTDDGLVSSRHALFLSSLAWRRSGRSRARDQPPHP